MHANEYELCEYGWVLEADSGLVEVRMLTLANWGFVYHSNIVPVCMCFRHIIVKKRILMRVRLEQRCQAFFLEQIWLTNKTKWYRTHRHALGVLCFFAVPPHYVYAICKDMLGNYVACAIFSSVFFLRLLSSSWCVFRFRAGRSVRCLFMSVRPQPATNNTILHTAQM